VKCKKPEATSGYLSKIWRDPRGAIYRLVGIGIIEEEVFLGELFATSIKIL